MNYRITAKAVDFLPNVLDMISDPTIKGEVVGEDGKLTVINFTDDLATIGEVVVSHRNWRGSISINGRLAIGEWDDPTSTLFIDANQGSCQVAGDELVVAIDSLALSA
jgi:hypothetical protein